MTRKSGWLKLVAALVFSIVLIAAAFIGCHQASPGGKAYVPRTSSEGALGEAGAATDSRAMAYDSAAARRHRDGDFRQPPAYPQHGRAGVVTAGEWHDLTHWDFWNGVLTLSEMSAAEQKWNINTRNRVSVLVVDQDDRPAIDVPVALRSERSGRLVAQGRTNNKGVAELFINMFQPGSGADLSRLKLMVDRSMINAPVRSAEQGVNKVLFLDGPANSDHVEIALIVDSTGSMSDEMAFLKTDLESVIDRVSNQNSNLSISTAALFYRDEGDDFVTRRSGFTNNLSRTVDFVRDQQAGGGGDFPEAVHTALDEALTRLDWSDRARSRIAFLLLDAPPHSKSKVYDSLHESIRIAAQRGIRIVPITASGIDKDTEFLMRSLAISTNGTYVFITDHSGVGNDHLEPTIGSYDVEKLNDLLVRLIGEYTD